MKQAKHKNTKFKIGDRVIYNPVETGNGWLAGEHGTVIYVDDTGTPYTVEFDRNLGDLGGYGITDMRAKKHGYTPRPLNGWFCKEENLIAEE